jgi:hypothetical protein
MINNIFQAWLLRAFILGTCLILLVGTIFVLLKQIDVFITRKETSAQLIGTKENTGDRDHTFTLSYFDSNKNLIRKKSVRYKYQDPFKNSYTITIAYTKRFDQLLLKGYSVPRFAIFFMDLFLLLAYGYEIAIGIAKKFKY